MVRFILLLPGADGKRQGGNPLAPDMFDYRASNTFNYFSELNPERRALIRAVQAQAEAGSGLDRLLGTAGEGVEEAVEINRHVFDAPLLAAIERYGPGVMYRAMEFETLPTGAQRRLLENGVILSGMFGLLRPDDLIPDYRLRIDATVDGIGSVTGYWRDIVSPRLDRLVEDKIVWNLLPASHEEAWVDGVTYARMYRVRFYKQEDGERKAVAHGARELGGSLVHYIVERLAETPEALLDWDAPGGFEPEPDAYDVGERGGTLVFVRHTDWEERRAARHAARAEETRPRNAPAEEDAAEAEE